MKTPYLAHYHTLIVGGSSAAVSAACALAEAGKKVLLLGDRPYLGEDVCAHANYWAKASEVEASQSDKIVAPLFSQSAPSTPMQVKNSYEQACRKAGVEVLLQCHSFRALLDEQGHCKGAIIANRSGFQSVSADHVIDASENALLAKVAGVLFTKEQSIEKEIQHTVFLYANADYQGPKDAGIEELTKIPYQDHRKEDKELRAIRVTLRRPLSEENWEDNQNQRAALTTELYEPGVFQVSERAAYIPQVRVDGQINDDIQTSVFSTSAGCWVLSARAALSDEQAAAMQHPVRAAQFGLAVAAEILSAAEQSVDIAQLSAANFSQAAALNNGEELRARDRALRPHAQAEQNIDCDYQQLPVLAEGNVIVCGGGTGGAPAGIAAARAGAKTFVLEAMPGLGGVGTYGQICSYWYGNRCGFTAEMDKGTRLLEDEAHQKLPESRWTSPAKSTWQLRELVKAGGLASFNAVGAAVLMNDKQTAGVFVANPDGAGIIRAQAIVDSTGSAEIAAAAGAPVRGIDSRHVAVQGTGLCGLTPEVTYNNSDHNFSDDADVLDASAFLIASKEKFKSYFDSGQLIDSREREQIIGEYELTPMDMLLKRTYPDTICQATSNFDTHGFTVHPLFIFEPTNKDQLYADVPYRALMPQIIDGVLVTGLGISAHRDCLPVVRMQPDVQNHGYAAGYAAALAAKEFNGSTRSVPVRRIQEHLVDINNLEKEVLDHQDSFPIPDEHIQLAIAGGLSNLEEAAAVFADPDRSIPLLSIALADASEEHALRFARALALMRNANGIEILRKAIDKSEWDLGWNYKGMGQFGRSVSAVDGIYFALSRVATNDDAPRIQRALGKMGGDSADFSHCRVLALCAERLASLGPQEELAKSFGFFAMHQGIYGYSQQTIDEVHDALTKNHNENNVRNLSLREIYLARAAYLLNDPEGNGEKILREYSNDLRGHFARHARAILAEKKVPLLTA